MRTALLLFSAWIIVSLLMATCWAVGARLGYRRAIEDVRKQAIEGGADEMVIYLDDVETLAS